MKGQVLRPRRLGGGHWAFADGKIVHPKLDKPIEFVADENGCFDLDNMPIGTAKVIFSWHEGDWIFSIDAQFTIQERQTTQIEVSEK